MDSAPPPPVVVNCLYTSRQCLFIYLKITSNRREPITHANDECHMCKSWKALSNTCPLEIIVAPLDEHPRAFGGILALARLPPWEAAPKPLKGAINVICSEMINICVFLHERSQIFFSQTLQWLLKKKREREKKKVPEAQELLPDSLTATEY